MFYIIINSYYIIVVRETGVSRHQGGPIEDPPETPPTWQHYIYNSSRHEKTEIVCRTYSTPGRCFPSQIDMCACVPGCLPDPRALVSTAPAKRVYPVQLASRGEDYSQLWKAYPNYGYADPPTIEVAIFTWKMRTVLNRVKNQYSVFYLSSYADCIYNLQWHTWIFKGVAD